MDQSPAFELQAHVDALYADEPRRLTFEAQTPAAFEDWRRALAVGRSYAALA